MSPLFRWHFLAMMVAALSIGALDHMLASVTRAEFSVPLIGVKDGRHKSKPSTPTQSRVVESAKVVENVGAEALVMTTLVTNGGSQADQTTHLELVGPGDGVKMEFVLIPAGKFTMGSPKREPEREDDEEQHDVEITRPFYLGKYEVTRGQFRQFVEDTHFKTEAESDGLGGWGFDFEAGECNGPKYHREKKALIGLGTNYSWRNAGFLQTDNHPVMNVSWNDATAFGRWLGQKTGKAIRMPTEAEWEYACRAGTSTRYNYGDDPEILVNFGNTFDGTAMHRSMQGRTIRAEDGYVFTAPVGRFKPNGFGLYDMHGNVWEWCQDWFCKDYSRTSLGKDPAGPMSGDSRVRRGGAWSHHPGYARSARRDALPPMVRSCFTGFRVAFCLD